MKKKAFKRSRKRFQAVLDKWLKPLGLLWWHIDVFYHRETPKSFKKKRGVTAAKVIARWKYMEAAIYVNTPAIPGMDDEELDRVVIHELCHILVNEMREAEMHHEERVCTRLAQAFAWVYREGQC